MNEWNTCLEDEVDMDGYLEVKEDKPSKSLKRRPSVLADMIRDSLVQGGLDEEVDDGEQRAKDFYDIMKGLDQSMKKKPDISSQGVVSTTKEEEKDEITRKVDEYDILSESSLDNDGKDGSQAVGGRSGSERAKPGGSYDGADVTQEAEEGVSSTAIDDIQVAQKDIKDKKNRRKSIPAAAVQVPRTLKDDVRDLCITSASSRCISFREPSDIRNKQSGGRRVNRRSSLTKLSSAIPITEDQAVEGRHESGMSQLKESEPNTPTGQSIKVIARRRSIEELAMPLRRRSVMSIPASVEPSSPYIAEKTTTSTQLHESTNKGSGGEFSDLMTGFDNCGFHGGLDEGGGLDDDFGHLHVPPTRRHSSMKPRPPTPSLANLLPKCSAERKLFYGPIAMTTRGTVKFNKVHKKLIISDSRFNAHETSLKHYVGIPKLATNASLHTANRQRVHLSGMTPSSLQLPSTTHRAQRQEQTLYRPATR